MPLIITPASGCGFPERIGQHRGWGFATSSTVCARSSPGESVTVTDLEDLAVWSAAEHQADFVLVRPAVCSRTSAPLQPSPYLPQQPPFLPILDICDGRNAFPSTPWRTPRQRQARDRQDQSPAAGGDCRVDSGRSGSIMEC